jgi:hypothetical protein
MYKRQTFCYEFCTYVLNVLKFETTMAGLGGRNKNLLR